MASLGQAAVSSVVENGLLSIVYGEEFSIKTVVKDVAIDMAIGVACKYVSDFTSKLTNKIFVKKPNYSQYQHYYRTKGLNLTKQEVYERMRKRVKYMGIANQVIDYSLLFSSDLLIQIAQ